MSVKARGSVIATNGAANVLSGGSAFLMRIALPPIYARALSEESFNVWSAVLQLSALVILLNVGVATAVGRFVAETTAAGQTERRNQLVSSASLIVAGVAGAGMVLVGAIILWLPEIFPQMPRAFVPQARWGLLFLGFSNSVYLFVSVFEGAFVGIQKNWIPALCTSIPRLIAICVMALALRLHKADVLVLSAILASFNIVGSVSHLLSFRLWLPAIRSSWRLITKPALRQISVFCSGLLVWQVGMILVSGLDTTIVGILDFHSVAFYAVAISITTAIAGLQNALFSPLMPEASRLVGSGNHHGLGALLISSTRWCTLALCAITLPFILFPKPILTLWVGPLYASHASVILQLLALACLIRYTATTYALLLIASDQQRLVLITPLLEGMVNLGFSLFLGYRYGAVGVAWGTLIGVVFVTFANFFYNMPRTKLIEFSWREYLMEGILKPVFCSIPFAAASWLVRSDKGFSSLDAGLVLVGSLVSMLLGLGVALGFRNPRKHLSKLETMSGGRWS